jgi:GWxTD domain-containing protein
MLAGSLQGQAELRGKHHLYDLNSEVKLDYRVAQNNSTVALFLKVSLKEINSIGKYVIKYTSYAKIDEIATVNSDTVEIRNSLIDLIGSDYYFRIDIPYTTPINLVVVELNNFLTGTNYDFNIPINSNNTIPGGDLIIMRKDKDTPVFRNFLTSNDTIRIKSIFGGPDRVYLYHYVDLFNPASPPFVSKGSDMAKELVIDTAFSIPHDEPFSLSLEGLFFIQTDTSGLEGISLNITDRFFPKTALIDDLIERIVYISTSKEFDLLKEAGTKKAFDTYWMEVTKSQERAKRIIRNYYDRIEEANQLFSYYKEGWMTDQGMIYIIYGPPNQVNSDLGGETWTYQKTPNLPKTRFSFVRLKNIFTNHHMELIRNEDYSQNWFRTIDLWRRGIQVN